MEGAELYWTWIGKIMVPRSFRGELETSKKALKPEGLATRKKNCDLEKRGRSEPWIILLNCLWWKQTFTVKTLSIRILGDMW